MFLDWANRINWSRSQIIDANQIKKLSFSQKTEEYIDKLLSVERTIKSLSFLEQSLACNALETSEFRMYGISSVFHRIINVMKN